jgi:hypothetical protein
LWAVECGHGKGARKRKGGTLSKGNSTIIRNKLFDVNYD